jgi:hypothetical protein
VSVPDRTGTAVAEVCTPTGRQERLRGGVTSLARLLGTSVLQGSHRSVRVASDRLNELAPACASHVPPAHDALSAPSPRLT